MITIDVEMPSKCCECPCFRPGHPGSCWARDPGEERKIMNPYSEPMPAWCPIVRAPIRKAKEDAMAETNRDFICITYPSNIECPNCKKRGFVYYLGSNSKYVAKCINCFHFITREEKPLATLDGEEEAKRWSGTL